MKNDERDTPSLSPLENRWLTAEEAAAYIGVKVETLSKWRLRGQGGTIGRQRARGVRMSPRRSGVPTIRSSRG